MTTAIVVGSGPNGLAGAACLAQAGVDVTVIEMADDIGGGVRSSPMFESGLIVDHCSAIHMLAADSPLHRQLELERYGLRWKAAPIDLAHPLDDGSVGVLHQSVDQTADGLGADGDRWHQVFDRLVKRFPDLAEEVMGPVIHLPSHPITLGRFGVGALLPSTAFARLFSTETAKALWSGCAAHAFYPLDKPLTSAFALMLIGAGHSSGWVVAEGGSQAIADAMVASITANGGRFETGRRVRSLEELESPDIVLLDTSPSAAADIIGDRLPKRVEKAYRRFKHGPGAFKVDFAVDGGVPWTNPEAAEACTVHIGGTAEQIAASEAASFNGRMPDDPFVLVAQQYLADPSRSKGDLHPVWSYAHVPHGYTGDATEAIIGQIERFAPGFRERIVEMAVRSTTELSIYNPNFVGGDIGGGLSSLRQMVFRPRPTLDPYSTGVDGVYLCSASTPPGAGAHGMCGAHAAERALKSL